MTNQDEVPRKQLSRSKPTKAIKPKDGCRSRIEQPGQGLKESDVVAFNGVSDPAFVELITGILREEGKLSYRDALRETAFELGVSIETAKRYFERHSARRAEFCIENRFVTLRQAKR